MHQTGHKPNRLVSVTGSPFGDHPASGSGSVRLPPKPNTQQGRRKENDKKVRISAACPRCHLPNQSHIADDKFCENLHVGSQQSCRCLNFVSSRCRCLSNLSSWSRHCSGLYLAEAQSVQRSWQPCRASGRRPWCCGGLPAPLVAALRRCAHYYFSSPPATGLRATAGQAQEEGNVATPTRSATRQTSKTALRFVAAR